MYTTETTRTPDARSAQSGSILVVALVILVIAGSVSAGVAHLVGSGSTISANALQSEQAFYIAESVARSGPCEEGSYGKDNHVGHYNCVPGGAPCDSDQWHITAWIGNENQDNAQATHQICAPNPANLDDNCLPWDKNSDIHDGSCFIAEDSGVVQFTGGNLNSLTGPVSITIIGDFRIPGGGGANEFPEESQLCVLGEYTSPGVPSAVDNVEGFWLSGLDEDEDPFSQKFRIVEAGGGGAGPPGGGGAGPPGGGGAGTEKFREYEKCDDEDENCKLLGDHEKHWSSNGNLLDICNYSSSSSSNWRYSH